MDNYVKAMAVMEELFARDCQFAMATAQGNVPSVRIVDTYWKDGAFYIVTHNSLQKVKELEGNEHVALCSQMNRFSGRGRNIGHPLKPENKAIRDTLTRVFEPWYHAHNDEGDAGMCIVKVQPEQGFFSKDGTGYKVDFAAQTAESFPFDFAPIE